MTQGQELALGLILVILATQWILPKDGRPGKLIRIFQAAWGGAVNGPTIAYGPPEKPSDQGLTVAPPGTIGTGTGGFYYDPAAGSFNQGGSPANATR